MKEGFGNIRISSEEKSEAKKEKKEIEHELPLAKGLTRRQFLGASGAAGLLAYLKLQGFPTDVEAEKAPMPKEELAPVSSEVIKEYLQENKEAPMVFSPLEQLLMFGEIRDMKAGLQAVYDEHYAYLTATEEGRFDIKKAATNMLRYDIKKLIKPFINKGLPEELAYMIAIQETRGRNQISNQGARGMTGILGATARLLGFNPQDVDNPYIATQATATYFANERDKRFGEHADVDILLHAYNAGGGLYGFTQKTPREERTSENYYAYMTEYINTRFEKIKREGYKHTLDDEDRTLSHVSKRFNVSLEKLRKANNLKEGTVIHKGDELKIPFDSIEEAAKIVFRKPMENLRYTPEVKAKYTVLKETGLLGMFHPEHKKEKGELG